MGELGRYLIGKLVRELVGELVGEYQTLDSLTKSGIKYHTNSLCY